MTKNKEISNLHFITHDVDQCSHVELTELVCQGGVDWVQVRVKDTPEEKYESIVIEVKEVCDKHGAKLIVNDNVDIAKRINADGVHIGKNDIHPAKAREILGEDFIIGGTANTFEDIQRLAEAKVDYIGLGPFRFTSTKKNLSPTLGIEGYQDIISKCKENGINIPIIAIGGLLIEDIDDLSTTGVHGIAIASAITSSEDISAKAEEFLNKLNKNKN